MDKIKVLVVGMTGGIGGVESFICNLNHALNKDYYSMDFLTHQKINEMYLNGLKEDGGKIFFVSGIKDGIIRYIREIFKFYSLHKEYQVVHLNECGASYFLYVLPLMRYSNIKLIVHSHNGNSNRKVLHYILRGIQNKRANLRLACSDIAGQWMFGKKSNYSIIGNGINVKKYRYSKEKACVIKKELGLEDKFIVGSIARFEKQKNHDKIISIFEELSKYKDNVHLILVGDGVERERIERSVICKGLDEKISFLGIRNDVEFLLSSFDIFLLPSLYEGFPFVTVEAQAASLPMVVSNTITYEIDITDLIYRVSLDADDEEWCKCIDEISKNMPNRDTDDYANLLTEKGYNIDSTARKVEEMYSNLYNSCLHR